VTPDTALRLSKALGSTPEFWLNMQRSYDLRIAEKTTELGGIRRLIHPRSI
jgi:addiction module HigA family antidote